MNCDTGLVMHKHHIIPKYKGGSDDPFNLVKVTITRHAMFHYCNYQLWGNDEDRIAYLGLSKQITNDEIIAEKLKLSGKKTSIIVLQRMKDDPEFAAKMKAANARGRLTSLSEEVKIKRRKTLKIIKHQQGTKNSQYNTRWIYNLELRQNKKIPKGVEIPFGWTIGRIPNFDAYFKKIDDKKKRQEIRIKEKQEKVKHYEALYEIYVDKGYDYIKEHLNYNRTKKALVDAFKRHVKHYVHHTRANKQQTP